jgi:hypothetical protein
MSRAATVRFGTALAVRGAGLFGRAPVGDSPSAAGPVSAGYVGDNWRRIDNALRYGLRGLPGGSSLAQFRAGQHFKVGVGARGGTQAVGGVLEKFAGGLDNISISK